MRRYWRRAARRECRHVVPRIVRRQQEALVQNDGYVISGIKLCQDQVGVRLAHHESGDVGQPRFAMHDDRVTGNVVDDGGDCAGIGRIGNHRVKAAAGSLDQRNVAGDRRYADLSKDQIPLGECLADTVDRVMPYWQQVIEPQLKQGKRLIIAAHGNSLRAVVKYLDKVSEEDILKLNIPTGVPLVYELDDDLQPIKSQFLGDPDELKAAMDAVANQGKKASQ